MCNPYSRDTLERILDAAERDLEKAKPILFEQQLVPEDLIVTSSRLVEFALHQLQAAAQVNAS